MITDLGKIIDPAADKLMQLAMLVTLAINIPYMCILAVYLIVKEDSYGTYGSCSYEKGE